MIINRSEFYLNTTGLLDIFTGIDTSEKRRSIKNVVTLSLVQRLGFYLITFVENQILMNGGTVYLKWIAPLCSRYTTPPPLWEQFISSFIFVQFSHWNVQI